MENVDVIVVGAGFTGATFATLLADRGHRVRIMDKREYLGGNASDCLHVGTNIFVHRHGAHIFHTSNEEVMSFLLQFSDFNSYRHSVFATSQGKTYQLPFNLSTLEQIYERSLTPFEARLLMEKESCALLDEEKRAIQTGGTIEKNLERRAISMVGEKVYRKLIEGYTTKQWGRHPRELPENIITRLPVRFNRNPDYFSNLYQGMPEKGYSELVREMVVGPRIELRLQCDAKYGEDGIHSEFLKKKNRPYVIWSGAADDLFDYSCGFIEWRSLRFEFEMVNSVDYQGCAVMNHVDVDVPFTRKIEFKHFYPEKTRAMKTRETVVATEYPVDWQPGDERYYPVETSLNLDIQKQYEKLAEELGGIHMCGRLGSYKYLDMDQAIAIALRDFEKVDDAVRSWKVSRK